MKVRILEHLKFLWNDLLLVWPSVFCQESALITAQKLVAAYGSPEAIFDSKAKPKERPT